MSDENILNILNLPKGADPTLLERLFINKISGITKDAARDYSEEKLEEVNQQLDYLHAKLHDYFLAWVKEERLKNQRQDNQAYASTKINAEKLLTATFKFMKDSAKFAFQIERYCYQLETEASEMGEMTKENLMNASRMGSEIGALFSKNAQRKPIVAEKLKKYEKAYKIIKVVDADLDRLQAMLENLYGKDKAAAPMRSIISALRTENFTRIRTVFREIKDAKEKSLLGGNKKKEIAEIDNILKKIVSTLQDNIKTVMGEDERILVHTSEVVTAYNEVLGNMTAIKDFMVKNYVIYLRYKYVTMKGLERQLEEIASAKQLLTLYRKLGTCIAEPIKDLKDSRMCENEAIEPAQRQIQTSGPMIQNILDRAENMMKELRVVQVQFSQLSTMSLKKMEEK